MKKLLFFLLIILIVLFSYDFWTEKEIETQENISSKIDLHQMKASNSELKELIEVVEKLSTIDPPRNHLNISSLNDCADFIASKFKSYGLEVEFQNYKARGKNYRNVRAYLGDKSKPRIIIGAHYDVAGDKPGADDNASGVSVMINIAKRLSGFNFMNYSVEFVAFTLEEPPYFRTNLMGSNIHASKLLEEKVNVWGLINLEMVGFYSEQVGSQDYPVTGMNLLYPDKGNFIGVIGNTDNSKMVKIVSSFLKENGINGVESLVAPSLMKGVDFSDHLNYWKRGIPAIMLTDTAFYRNKHYHRVSDTLDKLNFEKMLELSRATCEGIKKLDLNQER